ncbi:MAG: alanine racemase [Verrucomicrobiota bacterium]|nr:alanine racemase [Verrucomicrobiota bacterium]
MKSGSLDQLDTPAVVVEHKVLLENIQWAQTVAVRNGLALRPHIKTHKCFEIARLQLAAGATGITASKAEEATKFIEAGFNSITVAYPVVQCSKLVPLFQAAREKSVDLRVIIDSDVGFAVLKESATKVGYRPGVFLKVDVGLHRVGVAADSAELIRLGAAIVATPALQFVGLLSHAGHAYSAAGPTEIREIARQEARQLAIARERLASIGVNVREISIGSTPTVLASDCYEGITEIRPGNYVFMDRTPLRLGLLGTERVALSIVSSIVSANDDYLIIDAGSKVLSSDLGAHGTGTADGFGVAYPIDGYRETGAAALIAKLSEEHGFIPRSAIAGEIGGKVRIIPNHACPVVNLADQLSVVHEDGRLEKWRVTARGAVH